MTGIGVVFLAFVLYQSLAAGSHVQLFFGFGLALVGLVSSFVSKYVGRSSFYSSGVSEAETPLV